MIFGYFWVFLGIFGYFWVLLGIFGYFWVLYCIDIVPILISYRYCIDILTYRTALGEEIFCLSYPDARDCCPLGLVSIALKGIHFTDVIKRMKKKEKTSPRGQQSRASGNDKQNSLIELVIGLIELGIGLIGLGIGLIELRIGLIEQGIGPMELGVGLRMNNARRTVLARVSGLVIYATVIGNLIIYY